MVCHDVSVFDLCVDLRKDGFRDFSTLSVSIDLDRSLEEEDLDLEEEDLDLLCVM